MSDDEYCLEITVICLEGISSVTTEQKRSDSPVTATVSFGGSARNMEVCTSTMCGYTGQPMIESEEILYSCPGTKDNQIVARWGDWEQSTDVVARQPLPHLKVVLQKCRPKLPRMSLAMINRDSSVISRSCIDDIEETKEPSKAICNSSSVKSPTVEKYNDENEVWTHDDGLQVLPEIVELTVRLRSRDPERADQIGIAYLLAFGDQEDKDIYVLDLPVKKPPFVYGYQLEEETRPPVMLLLPETRLRVMVRTNRYKSNTCTAIKSSVPNLASFSSASSASQDSFVYLKHEAEQDVGAVMEKFRQQQLSSKKTEGVEKHSLDDVDSCQDPTPKTKWSYDHVFHSLKDALQRCNDVGMYGMMRSDTSVDSSIVTRESMLL